MSWLTAAGLLLLAGLLLVLGWDNIFFSACVAGLAVWAVLQPRRAVVIGLLGFTGVALAIPRLLGSSMRSKEDATVAELRVLASAQAGYAAANGGYFDGQLSCLSPPKGCIPGYEGPQDRFLAEEFASVRNGYVRTFIPGPPPAPLPPTASPTSITAFACTAVPQHPRPGARGFCADSSGMICATFDGSKPPITPDSRCDLEACTQLE